MKKIISFILFFYLAAYPQKNFKADFDFARYSYNDSLGFIEIYYSFYQDQFSQIKSDESELTVSGRMDVLIQNVNNQNIVVDRDYQFNSLVDPSDTNSYRGFTGVLSFVLPYGDYNCKLTAKDNNNSERSDSLTFNFDIKEYPEERFAVSDIELAGNIKKSENTTGMFYKNTYEVIPNPSNVYGEALPVVYFYAEMYNIDSNNGSELLKVEHILLNSAEQIFYKKSKFIPRTSNSAVETGTVNISKAPSGAYTLVVSLTDSINNIVVYSSKRLFVFNPGIVDTQIFVRDDRNILASEFSSMSEEELDEVFGYSSYIATEQDHDAWDKLNNEDGKRKFIFDFWLKRDRNTATPENEFKRDYFNRVKLANERYTTIQRKGWRTDRGRILITYGEPSEIERYPNQVDTRPYEIWQYNEIEGGVVFIFADTSGFNDYRLIHSTARGELRDDYWQRKIQTL